jgi:SAM-dependent methyltransferase
MVSSSSIPTLDFNHGSTVKVGRMTTPTDAHLTPNHHADHPGFAGTSGFLFSAGFALFGGADARLAVRLADVRATDDVLDIGCGPGNAVRAAARTGARATGVDPAQVMRRTARRLSRSGRVRYLDGTAEALPVEDDSMTVVLALATVHHWADLDAALREVRRVLRPGGRLLAIERNSPPGATGLASHGWTDDQAEGFAEVCRSHGFEDVQVGHPEARRSRKLVTVLAR